MSKFLIIGGCFGFLGVVGQQPDLLQAQIDQDLRAESVFAEVHCEAEFLIGFDGVVAFLLQLVGLDLGRQADAAARPGHQRNASVEREEVLHASIMGGTNEVQRTVIAKQGLGL